MSYKRHNQHFNGDVPLPYRSCGGQDSNLRPLVYETNELTSAPPRCISPLYAPTRENIADQRFGMGSMQLNCRHRASIRAVTYRQRLHCGGKASRTLVCGFGDHYPTIEIYPPIAERTGFEPVTLCLTGRRSNLLSYQSGCVWISQPTHKDTHNYENNK